MIWPLEAALRPAVAELILAASCLAVDSDLPFVLVDGKPKSAASYFRRSIPVSGTGTACSTERVPYSTENATRHARGFVYNPLIPLPPRVLRLDSDSDGLPHIKGGGLGGHCSHGCRHLRPLRQSLRRSVSLFDKELSLSLFLPPSLPPSLSLVHRAVVSVGTA